VVVERLAGAAFQAAFWLPLVICTWLALTPAPPEALFRVGDFVLHAGAFAYLAFASRLAFPAAAWPYVVLWLLAFGAGIELLQGIGGQRSAEWADLAVDAVGIVLGLLLYRVAGQPLRRWVLGMLQSLFR